MPREPFLQLLRHAVGAAFVAAIGDRDAQIRDAVPEAILHGRGYGGAFRESRLAHGSERESRGIMNGEFGATRWLAAFVSILLLFGRPNRLPGGLTLSSARLDLSMKSQLSSWALLACIATGALVLSGCSTISSRIDANRAAFDQLPPQEQALVSQGRIQGGMSQQAVYIAWGQPQGKAVGMVRGVPTETWVYTQLTAAYGPYGYGYWRIWLWLGGICGTCWILRAPWEISLLRGFRRSLLEPILLPICGIGELSGEDRFIPTRPGGGVPIPHAQRLLRRGGRFPTGASAVTRFGLVA